MYFKIPREWSSGAQTGSEESPEENKFAMSENFPNLFKNIINLRILMNHNQKKHIESPEV